MRWQICQCDGYIEESIMRIERLRKDLTCTEPTIRSMLDTFVIRVTIALMKEIECIRLERDSQVLRRGCF